MNPEREYIDYVIAFSLTMFSASAVYFFNPSNPLTYFTLLAIPLMFGYTAYTSREGFRKSSLLSLVALFFAIINPLTAVLVLFIAVGNPLVSVFSGGEHFHDYFHAISVPLIITGLVIGGVGYGIMSSQPELKQQTVNEVSNFLGHGTESFMKQSNLLGDVQNSQIQIVESTSKASVSLTAQIVRDQSFDTLETDDKREVISALNTAQQQVPENITSQIRENTENRSLDVSEKVSDSFRTTIGQTNMMVLIPLTAFLIYSLNPILGLLTALFATMFGSLDRKFHIF